MSNILFLIEQKAVKPANTNWFFRWHRLTDLKQFRHGRAHRQTITGNRQETQGWLLERVCKFIFQRPVREKWNGRLARLFGSAWKTNGRDARSTII